MDKLKAAFLPALIVIFSTFAFGQKNSLFRCVSGFHNWEDTSSWEILTGSVWLPAKVIPDSTNDVLVIIGSTLEISRPVSCKNIVFQGNTSTIDLNTAAILQIFGNADFRLSPQPFIKWVKDARVIFRGTTNQEVLLGGRRAFRSLNSFKDGGNLTFSNGTVLELEESFSAEGRSKVIFDQNLAIEGVLFDDSSASARPSFFISENSNVKITSYIRSGKKGQNPVGFLHINGGITFSCSHPSGINFGSVVVGNGKDSSLLKLTGNWGFSAFSFSSLEINSGGTLYLDADQARWSPGSVRFNPGSFCSVSTGLDPAFLSKVRFFDNLILSGTQKLLIDSVSIKGKLELHDADILFYSLFSGKIDVGKNLFAGNSKCSFRNVAFSITSDLISESSSLFLADSSQMNPVFELGRNFSMNKGSVLILSNCTSDPVLTIGGDLLLDSSAFIGTTHPGGSPVLEVEGGILVKNRSSFKAATSVQVNQSTMLMVNFTNIRGRNKSSVLMLSNGLSYKEALFRFSVQKDRVITLGADVELGGLTGSTAHSSFELSPFSQLNTGIYVIRNAVSSTGSRFILNSDATLGIGHPDGVCKAGEDKGAIQTTIRTFLTTCNYIYNGSSAQETGSGLPGTIRSLLINNTGASGANILKAGNSISLGSGNCKIVNGILDMGNHSLTGTGALEMQGGELRLSKVSSSVLLPEISGDYLLTGGIIELYGDGRQIIRGGRTYHHLKFSGNNSEDSTYKNPSSGIIINAFLEIKDKAIFTATDNAGNALTVNGNGGLIMSGDSRFCMKKLNATLPELTATNPGTDYLLTGGTIELYGSKKGQTHSLNGSKGNNSSDISYFNVELKADEPNDSDANIVLQSSISVKNKMIVFSPATFRVSNTFSIKGPGDFELKPGAGLYYGSPDGITNEAGKGNLRLTGKIQLPQEASYGFIGGVNMVSGNLLPDSIHNLLVNKTGGTGCKLSKTLYIQGNLNFNKGKIIPSGNTKLKMGIKSNVSGMSNSGYVEGSVSKTGNTPFIYPTGKNGFYRPISHSAPQKITDEFEAEYFNSNPQVIGTALDTGLKEINSCEYWMLNRINGNSDLQVSLSYNEQVCPNGTGSELCVTKWDGVEWKNLGNNGMVDGNAGNGTITSSVKINSFSPFTLGVSSNSISLPLKIISFNVYEAKSYSQLKWVAESSFDKEYFCLERSLNGEEYFSIDTLYAAEGNNINFYEAKDYQITNNVVYYRLKIVNSDGNFYFSKVISLKRNSNDNFIEFCSVLPENTCFVCKASGGCHLDVYEASGRKIVSTEFTSLINLKEQIINASGYYFIRITGAQSSVFQKLIYIR